MNKEMILNLEDLNSILNYLNIDKDEYFKKLNLIAEKIEGKMQEPYFLKVLDTETMAYMFYRIKNDSSEIFQYENEHKWLMDCLKNADSKFQGIEEALRTLMIKKYYNFWNQKNSSKMHTDEWMIKTYERITGLKKKRLKLKDLREVLEEAEIIRI